jgi:hypothetical protein
MIKRRLSGAVFFCGGSRVAAAKNADRSAVPSRPRKPLMTSLEKRYRHASRKRSDRVGIRPCAMGFAGLNTKTRAAGSAGWSIWITPGARRKQKCGHRRHFFISGRATPMKPPMKLFSWANGRAVSSAVEHRFYTPGVGSSILSPPTNEIKDLARFSETKSSQKIRLGRPWEDGGKLRGVEA